MNKIKTFVEFLFVAAGIFVIGSIFSTQDETKKILYCIYALLVVIMLECISIHKKVSQLNKE